MDEGAQFDQLKLIAYIIDPQRAKAVFEPQAVPEVSNSSQDWFVEEVKRNSKMAPLEVENLLKQDAEGVGEVVDESGEELTRIERV